MTRMKVKAMPIKRVRPCVPLVYVVRFATIITEHLVSKEKWEAEPSPRALCGLHMTGDVFVQLKSGTHGALICAVCIKAAQGMETK